MNKDIQKAIKDLKQYKFKIPKNTYKTMKGQILSGDIEGFYRGINRIASNSKISID